MFGTVHVCSELRASYYKRFWLLSLGFSCCTYSAALARYRRWQSPLCGVVGAADAVEVEGGMGGAASIEETMTGADMGWY